MSKQPTEGQLVIVKLKKDSLAEKYSFSKYENGKYFRGYADITEFVEDWISADYVENIFEEKEVNEKAT